MMRYGVLIFLTLFGCGPSSPKDFRVEGEAKCRELVSILERVETREEMLQIESVLKKKFNELVKEGKVAVGEKDAIVKDLESNFDMVSKLYDRVAVHPAVKTANETVVKPPEVDAAGKPIIKPVGQSVYSAEAIAQMTSEEFKEHSASIDKAMANDRITD